MTKVLVTGASGFIGSHTVLEFLNNGYEVRGSIRDLARADALKAMLAKHTEHTRQAGVCRSIANGSRHLAGSSGGL